MNISINATVRSSRPGSQSISGGGLIDGDGHIKTGTPKKGGACKMWGLVSSSDIHLSGISMKDGGWFTMLATNITGLELLDLQVFFFDYYYYYYYY